MIPQKSILILVLGSLLSWGLSAVEVQSWPSVSTMTTPPNGTYGDTVSFQVTNKQWGASSQITLLAPTNSIITLDPSVVVSGGFLDVRLDQVTVAANAGAACILYSSEQNAVAAAAATYWQQSIDRRLEYGGVVYKVRENNRYGFIITEGATHSVTLGQYYPAAASDVVGYWHTHPNRASRGPSPADLIAIKDVKDRLALYTICYRSDRSRPHLSRFGPGGYSETGSMTTEEWFNSIKDDMYCVVLDAVTNQSYEVTLFQPQKEGFVRAVVGPVSFKYSSSNTVTFGIGPVTLDTRGNLGLGWSGTAGPAMGAVTGRANIPAVLTGNWKNVFSGVGGAGVGGGAELGGVGLSVTGGVQVIFKEEGPGNNWGQLY